MSKSRIPVVGRSLATSSCRNPEVLVKEASLPGRCLVVADAPNLTGYLKLNEVARRRKGLGRPLGEAKAFNLFNANWIGLRKLFAQKVGMSEDLIDCIAYSQMPRGGDRESRLVAEQMKLGRFTPKFREVRVAEDKPGAREEKEKDVDNMLITDLLLGVVRYIELGVKNITLVIASGDSDFIYPVEEIRKFVAGKKGVQLKIFLAALGPAISSSWEGVVGKKNIIDLLDHMDVINPSWRVRTAKLLGLK